MNNKEAVSCTSCSVGATTLLGYEATACTTAISVPPLSVKMRWRPLSFFESPACLNGRRRRRVATTAVSLQLTSMPRTVTLGASKDGNIAAAKVTTPSMPAPIAPSASVSAVTIPKQDELSRTVNDTDARKAFGTGRESDGEGEGDAEDESDPEGVSEAEADAVADNVTVAVAVPVRVTLREAENESEGVKFAVTVAENDTVEDDVAVDRHVPDAVAVPLDVVAVSVAENDCVEDAVAVDTDVSDVVAVPLNVAVALSEDVRLPDEVELPCPRAGLV
jgi:hypothetical protein